MKLILPKPQIIKSNMVADGRHIGEHIFLASLQLHHGLVDLRDILY